MEYFILNIMFTSFFVEWIVCFVEVNKNETVLLPVQFYHMNVQKVPQRKGNSLGLNLDKYFAI